MPPAALTLTWSSQQARSSATSSRVAPPVEKPVLVLMKSAPESETMRQRRRFSSSVSRQHSMMTLRMWPSVARRTAAMSSATASQSPSLTMARLMTMSTSSAPLATASAASKAFAAVVM